MHTPAFTHAGGIVLRDGTHGPELLVVRPTHRQGDEWVLPKGHIEAGETTEEAAVREVAEESGAVAASRDYVGFVEYHAKGEDVACAFFRMDLVSEGVSEEGRETAWVGLGELAEKVPFPDIVALVVRAIAMG